MDKTEKKIMSIKLNENNALGLCSLKIFTVIEIKI